MVMQHDDISLLLPPLLQCGCMLAHLHLCECARPPTQLQSCIPVEQTIPPLGAGHSGGQKHADHRWLPELVPSPRQVCRCTICS